jgi:DNA-directed RNA polymerase subunit RPC12/RpoP
MPWNSLSQLSPVNFRCGHCGKEVANDKGYFHDNISARRIYVCPGCDRPSYFEKGFGQFPGVSEGNDVDHLPDQLRSL